MDNSRQLRGNRFVTDQPISLYKYLSLRDDDGKHNRIKRVASMFIDSKIYFATANQFNDPFDCSFEVTMDADADTWKQHITEVLKRAGKESLTPEQLDEFVETMNADAFVSDEEKRDAVLKTKKSVRILSLSRRKDVIPMWSHYADNHEGICLEFTLSNERMFKDSYVLEVKYEEDSPRISFFDMTSGNSASSWLQRKHPHWKYEEECRVLAPSSETGIFKIPEKALTGVITGSRISDENRATVKSWVESSDHDVAVLEARERPDEYKLEILGVATTSK